MLFGSVCTVNIGFWLMLLGVKLLDLVIVKGLLSKCYQLQNWLHFVNLAR